MTPDEEFTIAFRRMNNGWAIIYSLRMVSTAGMPYAAKIVEGEQTSLVSDLTVSGQLKEFIIGIVDDDDLKKTTDFLSQKLTEQTLKNASSSVDAASLLIEPLRSDSHVVLPAGSLIEGKVVKKTPPRRLSRGGSLCLTFSQLTLPDGNRIPIAASLAGAELDGRSHTRMDAEGRLRGERPGKAWMAINIGVSAGLAKEVDDSMQLIIEAIVSTTTDASTAGTSRIVATCVSVIFLVTRHGRDVVLPRFTEMDVSLDRPLSLTPASNTGPTTTTSGTE